MVLKKAFDITNNPNYLYTLNKNLDYILGKNITDYSFVTSTGNNSLVNLNHLHVKNDGFTDIPKGAMVGGPVASSVSSPSVPVVITYTNPITFYFDTCTPYTKRYLDFPDAPFPNEPTIDYNARLLYSLYSLLPVINVNSFQNYITSHFNISVFPNPNSGLFTLKKPFKYPGNEEIHIYDVLGKVNSSHKCNFLMMQI